MPGDSTDSPDPSRDITGLRYDFPLRRDRHGYRPVYKLGNERGPCPYACTFCGVGKSEKVSAEWNIRRFDAKHAEYLVGIDGPYHPAIFNRGNVTLETDFSRRTLDHILNVFSSDSRVQYVSLNSREPAATPEVLDRLAEANRPFPIHFILGMESFSPRTPEVLGKSNKGEMQRFVAKLKPYNIGNGTSNQSKPYVFGLDVNLVFLPELYLDAGESRAGKEQRIGKGLAEDLRTLLSHTDPAVPCEINIHPFYAVESLPYESADLFMLLRILPMLQGIVEEHNRQPGVYRMHLFVGVVLLPQQPGSLPGKGNFAATVQAAIDVFNRTGSIAWEPRATSV